MAKRKTNADELHRSGFRCSNHFRAVWSYSPMYKQWGPAGWAPRPLFFDAHDSNTPNFGFLLEWLKMASNPPHSPSVRILLVLEKLHIISPCMTGDPASLNKHGAASSFLEDHLQEHAQLWAPTIFHDAWHPVWHPVWHLSRLGTGQGEQPKR